MSLILLCNSLFPMRSKRKLIMKIRMRLFVPLFFESRYSLIAKAYLTDGVELVLEAHDGPLAEHLHLSLMFEGDRTLVQSFEPQFVHEEPGRHLGQPVEVLQ